MAEACPEWEHKCSTLIGQCAGIQWVSLPTTEGEPATALNNGLHINPKEVTTHTDTFPLTIQMPITGYTKTN